MNMIRKIFLPVQFKGVKNPNLFHAGINSDFVCINYKTLFIKITSLDSIIKLFSSIVR